MFFTYFLLFGMIVVGIGYIWAGVEAIRNPYMSPADRFMMPVMCVGYNSSLIFLLSRFFA